MQKTKIFIGFLIVVLFTMISCEKDKDIAVYNMPVYPELFMVGDAAPAGWNIDDPTPMVVNETNPFVFTYDGELKAGYFKIPVSKGNWGCDYFMPVEDGEDDLTKTTVELVKGGNPDKKWKINEAGSYKVTINIENLDAPTIAFVKK